MPKKRIAGSAIAALALVMAAPIAALALIMAAPVAAPAVAPVAALSAAPLAAPVAAADAVATAAPGGIAYAHGPLWFSLTLPASWAGLYRVEEGPDGAAFINVRNENAGAGGRLFWINAYDGEQDYAWPNVELARANGKVFYAEFPDGVEALTEDAVMTWEYNSMYSEIASVLQTFRVARTVTARPTSSAVLVDGRQISFDAYNIKNNNYFKLRDLAYALDGSDKRFEVGWDAASNAISLTSGARYTAVGGEMQGKGAGDVTTALTDSRVYLDGSEVVLAAYTIGGNNYFRLRDVAAALDFGVVWDEERDMVVVDTSERYVDDGSSGAEMADVVNRKLGFAITVPASWTAKDIADTGDGHFIDCGNGSVVMRVYGETMTMPEEFYLLVAAGERLSVFVFGSGIQGWKIAQQGVFEKYMYSSEGRYVTFYVDYRNDPAWYEDYSDDIEDMARTLRDVAN